MTSRTKSPGQYMQREIQEAPAVFAAALATEYSEKLKPLNLPEKRAIYTIARGSSDAAANVLSYEFMRNIGLPMTSLPPSIFSLGNGVNLKNTAGLVISQSGASDDLIWAARGASKLGATVMAITNQPGSGVESASHVTLPVNAGTEQAVPATKTVIGSIGVGMALLGAMDPTYAEGLSETGQTFGQLQPPDTSSISAGLLHARHVYVIGRDTGYGAAHEIALKIKECCAIHAEAYSASEVLHGPLQLATNPLMVLILDTGEPKTQTSLDQAHSRFSKAGCDVYRINPGVALPPAAAAAALLYMAYPVILEAALALGHDPDAPATLSKVTKTT